jgi:hypothetical protein
MIFFLYPSLSCHGHIRNHQGQPNFFLCGQLK